MSQSRKRPDHPMSSKELMIGNERLLKLAEHLETRVPKEQFSMATWGWRDLRNQNLRKLNSRASKADEGFCGTYGCMMGHAAFIPEFQDQGLGYFWSESEDLRITLRGKIGAIEAAAGFFNMTHHEAISMFGNWSGHQTGDPVANATRLRRLVKKRCKIIEARGDLNES